jgi:repressor LexA
MPDLTQLTKRQREIYNFIKEKIESRGYGPTVREIGSAFDISSPNGVMCHLKALEKKGHIIREKNAARAIQLEDHHPTGSGLPLLGHVAAGSPTQAVENCEWLEFKNIFSSDNLYALKVKGQSMIDDHIQDGDYVVIRKQETARNGERVVAMIEGDVTLKKFYKERSRIRLEPANGNYAPIYVDPVSGDVRVLGVLAGVVRKC